MKKLWAFIPALLILNAPLWGQTPANTFPAASSSSEKGEDSDEKPFKPHWENELGLSSSKQQAGQNVTSISYTGSHHYDADGTFLSGEVEVSQQKVEGVLAKTGTLNVIGGVGLGFFSPSLAIGLQGGESALHLITGDISLGFQIWDPFSVVLSLGGNAGNHQGDVSAIIPALSGIMVQFDTSSWNSSLGMNFAPWDWWTISLTAQNEYDLTYQIQSINNASKKLSVNQTDHIASLNLGLDFTLFKGFVLGISPQAGQEFLPAGFVVSPLSGGIVYTSTATTQNFAAGTISVTYSFE